MDQNSENNFLVDLDGFEGPLDLLLSLAKEQKVDLMEISILELLNQIEASIASLENHGMVRIYVRGRHNCYRGVLVSILYD